jgi:hypothetical protein
VCRFFLFPLIGSVGHARPTAEIAFPAPAVVLQAPRPETAPETIRVSIIIDAILFHAIDFKLPHLDRVSSATAYNTKFKKYFRVIFHET